MSKIVCDICGTTYDDTTGACPVCGWNPGGNLDEIPTDVDDILNDDFSFEADELTDTAGAKGKAVFDYDAVNTRRRRSAAPAPAEQEEEEEEEESGSNKFLVFVLVILILALLAVSGYIAYTKLWKPNQMGSDNNKPGISAQPVESTEPSQEDELTTPQVDVSAEPIESTESAEPTELTIPCTELSLVSGMQELTFIGQNWRLMAKYAPDNTTDKVTYTSGDESVVTVDEYGRVTAVGEGETVVLISCGDKRIETPAVVRLTPAETEAPTESSGTGTAAGTDNAGTTVATPSSGTTLKLKRTDVTIGRRGVYITLELENGIAAEDVKWSTSDSSIATVYNGNVTAIGKGVCTIRAEYNGQVAECVVRCKF